MRGNKGEGEEDEPPPPKMSDEGIGAKRNGEVDDDDEVEYVPVAFSDDVNGDDELDIDPGVRGGFC